MTRFWNYFSTDFNWGDLFRSIIPQWVQDDLIERMPTSIDYIDSVFTIMFSKHNLLIYFIYCFQLYLVICFSFIYLLKNILKYREYLQVNYPMTLGQVASYTNFLNNLRDLLVFKSAFIILYITQIVNHLKENYIPQDMGELVEYAIDNLN